MLARIQRAVRNRISASAWMNRDALRERERDRAGGHPVAADAREHLTAALDWLVRAQDATGCGGVARGYSVAWNPHFRRWGWQPAYPETTGYIIPTFFDAAAFLSRPDLRERAIRMADWELEVQLPSGAVQGGVIGEQDRPTPAVFNTGQVIFGLLRAHQETGAVQYLTAARRAADYLLEVQSPDGGFRKGQSQMARADCTTYYTRAAWGLCLLGVHLHERRYVAAGERNVEFALSQQLDNGWFQANCLVDPRRPLLHTIGYATEGVLEIGLLVGREDFISAARRTALAVARSQRTDGGLSGRFASDWSPQADWDCLTGDAQMAIIWWRLGTETGDADLQDRARAIVRFVMHSQNRTSADPGLAGGIKGSFPIDGEYGRYEVLNWATKFFVDAVLLTIATDSRSSSSPDRPPL
jgi:hypothetical protein